MQAPEEHPQDTPTPRENKATKQPEATPEPKATAKAQATAEPKADVEAEKQLEPPPERKAESQKGIELDKSIKRSYWASKNTQYIKTQLELRGKRVDPSEFTVKLVLTTYLEGKYNNLLKKHQ